eukprot:COSAG01_NODE_55024_length_328_cov_0.672489_1_plen_82_part_10
MLRATQSEAGRRIRRWRQADTEEEAGAAQGRAGLAVLVIPEDTGCPARMPRPVDPARARLSALIAEIQSKSRAWKDWTDKRR